MNILLINHYSGGPEFGMEFRPYYLAQEWQKMGHNVTIVAGSFSHLRKINPSVDSSFTEQVIDGIKHIWLKTPTYDSNGIKRVFSMFSFVSKLLINRRKIIRISNPDVVIASSTYPLDIHGAKYIADKANARLIFEVHDLWPLTPMELGDMSPSHPFIRLLQHAEDKAYRCSDNIVSMLPCAQEHMLLRGMAPQKFHCVPNGIVIEDWKSDIHNIPPLHKNALEELSQSGKFIIGYAGGHAVSNSLITLINTSDLVKNDIAIVLVGDGAEKENLIQQAKKIGFGNVFFLPSIDKYEIPDLLNYFDCCYIGAKKSTLYRFGVSPNKIFDYMMAKKPIIQAIEAGNDMVKDANCGLSIGAENSKVLAEAITTMSEASVTERFDMGLKGYEYVSQKHDYSKLAKDFLVAMTNFK